MRKSESDFLEEELRSHETLARIRGVLPSGEVHQWSAEMALEKFRFSINSQKPRRPKILDLGCGQGQDFEFLAAAFRGGIDYVGLDIEESPEVRSRSRVDLHFETFDGVEIPFRDQEFDVVWSKQVLEHVRHIDALVAHVMRVLRPGGIFVGSVSNLEPYHSSSMFNLTPFGLCTVLTESGLDPLMMAPGADAFALIQRSLDNRRAPEEIWTRSRFNHEIATTSQLSESYLKYWKMLKFCGHLVFVARR